MLFVLINYKSIFEIIKEVTSRETSISNKFYFVKESLTILNLLLNTLQKPQLIENENKYLEFISPYLQFNLETVNNDPAIKVEAYKALYTMIINMKESNFKENF